MLTPSHASPRLGAAPTGDDSTGEIRVPLQLFALDRPVGAVDLVLSRVEAEHLHAALTRRMNSADRGARGYATPQAV
ncbi:hypothetical protein [Streptomyces marianii]|uniref:Uncharacterized protein n=1 Tax=Streptomyces marianii TaxID=1817406 RepID=A0A5R9EDA3_9ACTN|nr:hypothetical protein [Streptomyces marianii]TLQ46782.1 hypothetical protein FEF34_30845 [Streptomyces marianii]